MTSIYQGRTKTTVAAVYLSLKGRVREAARGISITDLKKDDGVGEIIRILDEIFQCNETTRAYHAFKDYVEYRRSSDQNFSSLVVEYEKRYREVKRYRLDLLTGVQAFFLLQAANLTPDLEKLVRTAATLVYGDMREKIQKVLSDSCGTDSGGVPVKEEDCYYTNRKGYYKKGGSNKKGNNFGKSKSKSGKNPVFSDGNIMRYHELALKVEETNMTVHIT